MRAGRLRHRVALQSATETRDAHGQPVKTWATNATVWGGVEPVRGKEAESANQIAAELIIRVVIRYRSDVTTDWRVVFESRNLEIKAIIDPDLRHKELQLMCREVV